MQDFSGKIITVTGVIDPNDIGITLAHEHLFLDVRKNHLPANEDNLTVSEIKIWESPVTLNNLNLARDMAPIRDNYILNDKKLALKELSEFSKFGGKTIIDVTSNGLKGDPIALKEISEILNVNIIKGCGWYQKVFYPSDMNKRTVKDLTNEIISDISVGYKDTGIKSGIIGEIGLNGNPLLPEEINSAKAAAIASNITGAAISLHPPVLIEEKHKILDIISSEGTELNRVVLGHSNHLAEDFDSLMSFFERDIYIAFDTLGVVRSIASNNPDAIVANSIPKIIKEGYLDKILLAQDVCWKTHLKAYGGAGYSFILEKFLPHLKKLGLSERDINTIMIDNPKKILTFNKPNK